jgi:branched-chain amino acid transport system substrate-binding protein
MHVVPLLLAALTAAAPSPPVLLGLDLEFGHATSTSDDAIKLGAQLAIDEINAAGGVLGGRPLRLVERDNRSNPARGKENLRELAAMPDLVAVLGGKFSPVLLEQLPLLPELGVILLDPWASAEDIIDGKPGSFAFRLSLKDGWAMPAILRHALGRGLKRPGLLLASTAWGRSSERIALAWLTQHPELKLAGVEWFNMGDDSLVQHARALRAAGADSLVLVANELEGSVLVRELAALPPAERVPVLSHWGITGGDFPALCGPALRQVDLVVVQTFSFTDRPTPRGSSVLAAARRSSPSAAAALKSPAGLAHAYDLTHILARAIDLAGTTDRRRIRDALERVRYEEGLLRRYGQPFAPGRHEALSQENVFLARWDAADNLVRVR